jgi:hypothetical protein
MWLTIVNQNLAAHNQMPSSLQSSNNDSSDNSRIFAHQIYINWFCIKLTSYWLHVSPTFKLVTDEVQQDCNLESKRFIRLQYSLSAGLIGRSNPYPRHIHIASPLWLL